MILRVKVDWVQCEGDPWPEPVETLHLLESDNGRYDVIDQNHNHHEMVSVDMKMGPMWVAQAALRCVMAIRKINKGLIGGKHDTA